MHNMKKILVGSLLLATSLTASAQKSATLMLHADQPGAVIPKEIYGHFAEHLGSCIYGGIWVGEDSEIPNIKGYRTDVFNALKDLKIPVLRWPGGCFADDYHWMDGIGPRDQRPKTINYIWGGSLEDNSFGTHEFLDLCEMLGCEAYVSGNVGSGTVEEMENWVEYMTNESDTPMVRLRRKNGRERAWKVKYFGVGNESWGCGGEMTADYYAPIYRHYASYCRSYSGNNLYKIACGAGGEDYNWTRVMMEKSGGHMKGLSLHFYTNNGWDGRQGPASQFDQEDFYRTLARCKHVEPVIKKHSEVMDQYDPGKNVGIILDEWGTWWSPEPNTHPTALWQQNTLRDAFVASLSFDIFHKYTDRLKMANIAQIVNVLQSVVLTEGDKMLLTPTYHVFKMYAVHQDATYLPVDVLCESCIVPKIKDGKETVSLPLVSATASRDKEGKIHLSISNIDAENSREITVNLAGVKATKAVGEILTSANITDHNTFDNPNLVKPVPFKEAKVKKDVLTVKLPAKSIVTLELQ